jgi:hypothetical protein
MSTVSKLWKNAAKINDTLKRTPGLKDRSRNQKGFYPTLENMLSNFLHTSITHNTNLNINSPIIQYQARIITDEILRKKTYANDRERERLQSASFSASWVRKFLDRSGFKHIGRATSNEGQYILASNQNDEGPVHSMQMSNFSHPHSHSHMHHHQPPPMQQLPHNQPMGFTHQIQPMGPQTQQFPPQLSSMNSQPPHHQQQVMQLGVPMSMGMPPPDHSVYMMSVQFPGMGHNLR